MNQQGGMRSSWLLLCVVLLCACNLDALFVRRTPHRAADLDAPSGEYASAPGGERAAAPREAQRFMDDAVAGTDEEGDEGAVRPSRFRTEGTDSYVVGPLVPVSRPPGVQRPTRGQRIATAPRQEASALAAPTVGPPARMTPLALMLAALAVLALLLRNAAAARGTRR